jgi:hypothetical protein
MSQGRQNTRPQLFTEQGSEAPSSAGYKPPRGDIQRGASIAVLPSSMDTRPRVSMLKPGNDPSLPSSYQSIILLGTIGKVFDKNSI